MPRLEKYLDDAYRSQAPFVRIVHGKGTGTLRKAVHQFLRGHPLVSSFRSGEQGEGDTGVTIVQFVGNNDTGAARVHAPRGRIALVVLF